MVTYHSTVVFKWFPDKQKVQLFSGGYRTTTKTRINQAFNQFGIPFKVFQKGYEWFVVGTLDNDLSDPIPFYDGMVISYSY